MITKRFMGLAAAAAMAFSTPAPAADSASTGSAAAPANVSPAVAEVGRLAQSGVGDDVVLAYVKKSPSAFTLSADEILYLKDKGVSSAVIGVMLSHEGSGRAGGLAPTPANAATKAEQPAAADAPAVQTGVEKNPPPEVAYFYDKLAQYGVWAKMDNFGWCWQPHEAVDRLWQPYCDGGRWVNTESGWFWESEYPWGATAFHYGRWTKFSQAGWVWAPDKTWGPAWVIWRTVEDLVGWAPLPPRSEYNSRSGWKLNGMAVSATFDFGLRPEHYTFVAVRDFTQHDLGSRRIGVEEVARVFARSTIINGYTWNNSTLVNQGIPTKQVSAVTHAAVPQVTIYDLPSGAAVPVGGPPMVYRPALLLPPRPPLVEMQLLDPRHPYFHHPGHPGGPGGPGGRGPGGPGGPGGGPGRSPGGSPGGGGPGKSPGGGGGAPGKKGP